MPGLETMVRFVAHAVVAVAVSAAVASGTADVGLGVMSAARVLNLDFLPIGWERYDFIMDRDLLSSDLLRPLFDILMDTSFRKKVLALGGYQVSLMGEHLKQDPGLPSEDKIT